MITNMGQDIGRIWVAAYEKGMTSVPPISPVFWSNMVSPNDSDNESQAAWFEGEEPNMIGFCLSLDPICGSWKAWKEGRITISI